jgi:hypothetical protein
MREIIIREDSPVIAGFSEEFVDLVSDAQLAPVDDPETLLQAIKTGAEAIEAAYASASTL